MKVVAASYPGIKEYLLQIYFTCDFPFLQILILIGVVHPLKRDLRASTLSLLSTLILREMNLPLDFPFSSLCLCVKCICFSFSI